MTAPVAIIRKGHRTLLKWHRGKRFPADTPFSRARIAEGLQAGASSEIDLQLTADGALAVLHDERLEQSTTSTGPVAMASADQVRAARLLDPAGRDSGENVMLFDDLAQLVATSSVDDTAILQLDLKEPLSAFSPDSIARFAEAVRPVARYMILSGGHADAVRRLSQAAPGLLTGHDPCLDGAMEKVMANGRYAAFVANALATAPEAEMFYLHFELIFAAEDAGFDMIAAFHAAGKTVDAWTIRGSSAEDLARVERLLALKADQITTNDADGLFAALG
ncbi:glycerophosphodiester phosphodiesterase family protein [uncultured Martelella sp.]|uniref:glycerophosphodiester phosphodiesterase n=1 Tax=uncultured Martelella sp. TaxID=392331 RepID=UPI0029C64463|nr:glycerophosphodiester phosphodiesterase family protein [uncultured Martelella sp.]